MKFSQMPYERPDIEEIKKQVAALTGKLKDAENYAAAREAFLELEELEKHIDTCQTLVSIRHSIDTRDKFYDEENDFWNNASPELQEYFHEWEFAMMAGRFKADFTAEFGDLMFINTEMSLKAFSPEIIPELQKENELADGYEKLLASAKVRFEGKEYTLSQMTPFKTDADDTRRLAAWKAEGEWYKEHQAELDDYYDKLVHLRDEMGKKLGYGLGWCSDRSRTRDGPRGA